METILEVLRQTLKCVFWTENALVANHHTRTVPVLDKSALKPLVDELRSLRGVDRVTAVSLLAEVGDLRRFPTAGAFMSYLGLTPSEHSSGGRRRTGGITKTGNSTLRRLLVERGKNTKTVTVAVARGLAGYVWDIASNAMNELQDASEIAA